MSGALAGVALDAEAKELQQSEIRRTQAEARFEAHAWVEVGGVALDNNGDDGAFVPFEAEPLRWRHNFIEWNRWNFPAGRRTR